jgi:hypothetical protein
VPVDSDVSYEVIAHAPVARADKPHLAWVAIGRWTDAVDDTVAWCLEQTDDRGEANHDLAVADEDAGRRLAQDAFEVAPDAWRPGPPRR